MKLTILPVLLSFCITCYSQKTVFYSVEPAWNHNSAESIRSQNLKTDSVYFYKKRKNNKDSSLVMTQYFDSLGNLIERNQFNPNGEVFRITDYTYTDTVLLKEESMSKDMFYINGSNLSKKIRTYDRDALGNVITEKEYSFFGDSLKSESVTEWNRVYDSVGNLSEEFVTLPPANRYLYHTYSYINSKLAEAKTYNINQSWMYSYLYEYDQVANATRVYLFNTEKTLSHEFFYNEKKLVMEKDYEQGHGLLDHITQIYVYNRNGILESQTFQNLSGQNFYYKHFYSK
jgi:hypothetical protein